MDLIKLSIHLFRKGMKDNGLDMCGIKRLDGTSTITRSTLFLEETWKTQLFTITIKQISSEKIKTNIINMKEINKNV